MIYPVDIFISLIIVLNSTLISEPAAMDLLKFEQQLAKRQQKFELLSPLGEACCHVRFTGPFLGERIIWDAYLQTLSYYVSNHVLSHSSARQFIEVGEDTEHGRLIRIGLNVPNIDEPVILKSLIMVRQYKLLAPGRHDYGELLQFPK
jgi:hypothetical protein